MKVRALSAASNMCCSRTRSSFRILDTCRGEYFVAEIAAELVGSAQIDLSTFKKRRKFPLHPSQIKEAGASSGWNSTSRSRSLSFRSSLFRAEPKRESFRMRFLLQKSAIFSRGSRILLFSLILELSYFGHLLN